MLLLLQNTEVSGSVITDVSWIDLSAAFGLILIAIGISRWQNLGIVNDLIIGAIRTVLQLVLVGYALIYIFAADRWYLTFAALLLMLIVATGAAVRRKRKASRELQWITGSAMLVGSVFTLLYVTTLVVRIHPRQDPRYLIPLFGMIVGSSMNGAALAIERLGGEMQVRAGEIEAYLALGANYKQATEQAVRQTLRASLIPTVNGLMVVGVVTLPGMMTGQILAGSSPLVAVRYQIVVMFMQAAAVAITTLIVTLWYRKTFFTPAMQLKPRPAETAFKNSL